VEGPPLRRYVVDASVAVKWFVPEEGSEPARRLKRGYEAGEIDVLSPGLIVFEVANALRYHPKIRLDASDLVVAIASLEGMSITVEMDEEGWARAFELSLQERISVYDAVYLALAGQSDAVFVTADKRLLDGLSDDLSKNVLPLSAFL
jgi:predicted nucleic acid-binding protein